MMYRARRLTTRQALPSIRLSHPKAVACVATAGKAAFISHARHRNACESGHFTL